MRATLTLTLVLFTLPVVPSGMAQAIPQRAEAGLWYLLVRRADPPEKNYYELTRTARIVDHPFSSEEEVRQYKPSPRRSCIDIITDLSVRYGVYQAWKVRVIGTSDSQKTPTSAKDGAYVLSYSRNPDWKFAAKKYKVVRTMKPDRQPAPHRYLGNALLPTHRQVHVPTSPVRVITRCCLGRLHQQEAQQVQF
jgi:hypothetical protein